MPASHGSPTCPVPRVSGRAIAEPRADDKTQPAGQQGLTSVKKNISKDTGKDNHGLTNAKSRIEDNMQDRADRKAADRDGKKRKQHDADDKTKHEKPSAQARATGRTSRTS